MNYRRKKSFKEKGITLVALVVTIIVLLILAGVTIQLLLGQNGLIKKAGDVSETWEASRTGEEAMMGQLHNDIHTHTQGNSGESTISNSGGAEEGVYRGLATASEAHEDIYNYQILTPATAEIKSDIKIASKDGVKIATSTTPGTAKIVGIDFDYIFNNAFGDTWPNYWSNSESYEEALQPYFQKMVIPDEATIDGKQYKITEIECLISSNYIGGILTYNMFNSNVSSSFNWNIIVPNGITTIKIYSDELYYRDNTGWSLNSISLPNTLLTIKPNAFYGCRYLEGINIPNSVTNIGEYAFAYCDAFTNENFIWNHNTNIMQDDALYDIPQVCPHSFDEDHWECGEPYCRLCLASCEHQWANGICTQCGWECDHNWNSSTGACDNCGLACSHDEWYDWGYCAICGKECTHNWNSSTGRCSICGMECEHSWNSLTGRCSTCNMACSHDDWEYSGYCTNCGFYDESHDESRWD